MRSIKVFVDEYTDERNFTSEEILSGGDTFMKINNYN